MSYGNVQNKENSFLDDFDEVVTDEINMTKYQGLQTHGHTKLLMKANVVMNDHFDIHSDFVSSITRPRWLNLCFGLWYRIMRFQQIC